MKKFTVILLVFFAFTINAQNLILNGSFEQNNIVPMGNCMTNISNNDYTNYMHYSTAFSVYGSMESFIYFDSCVTYTGVYAENITQDGNYSVLL